MSGLHDSPWRGAGVMADQRLFACLLLWEDEVMQSPFCPQIYPLIPYDVPASVS